MVNPNEWATFTMTADDFRKMAQEIPGAVEQSHMDHPDFRLYGKIFASLGAPDDDWGMVKLTPAQQRAFLKQAPRMFKPCNGAWAGKVAPTCISKRRTKPSCVRPSQPRRRTCKSMRQSKRSSSRLPRCSHALDTQNW